MKKIYKFLIILLWACSALSARQNHASVNQTNFLNDSECEPFIIEAIVEDADCHGASSGKITVIAAGDGSALSYFLLNEDKTVNSNETGASSGIFTDLPANVYHIAVLNEASCADTLFKVKVDEPEKLSMSEIVQTNLVSCVSGRDGVLTVRISGGVGGYDLYIMDSKGDTTFYYPSLEAGDHTFSGLKTDIRTEFELTDANECKFSAFANIMELSKPDLSLSEVGKIICYNNFGVITINATPHYLGNEIDFYWIEGENFEKTEPGKNNRFANLNGDTYTLYAQESNGCIGQKTVELTEPEARLSVIIKNLKRPQQNETNGSITVAGWGGWGGYTIVCTRVIGPSHQHIATVTVDGDHMFENLSLANYLFTITDKEGCIGAHILVEWLETESVTGETDLEATDLKIFPNPSSDGRFNIEWGSSQDRKVTLEVYNANGQLVYITHAQTGTLTTLDLSYQNSGIYLLRVPELNISRRLVKIPPSTLP